MTYTLSLEDGTAATAGVYPWLTNVDLATPSITISTDDESDTGIYLFVLGGTYSGSSYSANVYF